MFLKLIIHTFALIACFSCQDKTINKQPKLDPLTVTKQEPTEPKIQHKPAVQVSSQKNENLVTEWNLNVEGFSPAYFDKERNAFAINTVKQPTDKWAAANKIFDAEDGVYNVIFTSLLEKDGECSYIVRIDGKMIMNITNPRIFGKAVIEYTPNIEKTTNIKIKKGAVIQVEFLPNSNSLVKEGNAFGFARARWQDIDFIKMR